MDDKLLYPPKESAGILSVSTAKIYQLMASGELPSIRIGKSRRVTRVALEQFIAAQAEREGTYTPGPGPGGRERATA